MKSQFVSRDTFACRTSAFRAKWRRPPCLRRWLRVGLVMVLGLSLWGALLVPVVPVQAQEGDSRGERHVQVWVRKLASDNVEFGLRATDPSNGSITYLPLTNRYLFYNSNTLVVDRWYYSEPVKVGEGSGSVVLEVMARKLASGNVEFGLRIDGHKLWFPVARFFSHRTAVVDSLFFSSVFRTQSESSECSNGIVVPNPESNPGLVRDCMALLDAIQFVSQSFQHRRSSSSYSDFINWSNWSSNLAISSWSGVSLTSSTPKRVNVLNLSGLIGEFPPDFFRLEELTFFVLNNSQVVGGIPDEISQAKNLTFLFMSNNDFVYHNGFASHNGSPGRIPASLGSLSKLKRLRLSYSNLSGFIPPELGNLSNLENLELDDNNFSGQIPASLGDLSNLTNLTLARNGLSGLIPTELGNLSNLVELELNDNSLSGSIPASLGNLSKLTHFELQKNEFNGTLPESLQNLEKLEVLNASDNKLSEFGLTSMSGMTGLRVLDLGNNDFSGQLPTAISGIDVFLSNNNFSGEIPLGFADYGPRSLDLSNNNLTGGIPLDIRTNWYLNKIDLSNNRLSGAIPTDWARRPISVEIPKESLLGNDLNFSLVGRDITVVATDFSYLLIGGLYLFLAGNDFSGNIPPGLGEVTSLRFLDLGDNSLSGEIPAQLGNLTNLEALYLNDNGLTGSVPAQLGDLTRLSVLHLQSNTGLTGCVPASLETYVPWVHSFKPEPIDADVQVPPSLMNNGAVNWCTS